MRGFLDQTSAYAVHFWYGTKNQVCRLCVGKHFTEILRPKKSFTKKVAKIWKRTVLLFSRYYDYTISRNGVAEKHGNSFEKDYYTDLIKNDTVKFIQSQQNSTVPLFMVVARVFKKLKFFKAIFRKF